MANAGPGQTVGAGATVTLDGSGSFDPDGDSLSYLWSQTGGTAVTLSSSTVVQPTFTAPSAPGTLTFQLVVSDGTNSSSPADVTITVTSGPRRPGPVGHGDGVVAEHQHGPDRGQGDRRSGRRLSR